MRNNLTRRYNLSSNVWEIGYYSGTRFYIVSVVRI